MQIEMCMKGTGSMIKLMDTVHTTIQMEQNTKDFGRKTNNMGMEKKLGLMEPSTKETTR